VKKRELVKSITKVLHLQKDALRKTVEMVNRLPTFGLETLCLLRTFWPLSHSGDHEILRNILYDNTKDEAALLSALRKAFYRQLAYTEDVYEDTKDTGNYLSAVRQYLEHSLLLLSVIFQEFNPRMSSDERRKMWSLAIVQPTLSNPTKQISAIISPQERDMVTSVPPIHKNKCGVIDSTIKKVEASIYSIDQSTWRHLPNEMLTKASGSQLLPPAIRRGFL
jgi:hypothetical protein